MITRVKSDHDISLARWMKENGKGFYTYIKNKRVSRVGLLKYKEENLCLKAQGNKWLHCIGIQTWKTAISVWRTLIWEYRLRSRRWGWDSWRPWRWIILQGLKDQSQIKTEDSRGLDKNLCNFTGTGDIVIQRHRDYI